MWAVGIAQFVQTAVVHTQAAWSKSAKSRAGLWFGKPGQDPSRGLEARPLPLTSASLATECGKSQ